MCANRWRPLSHDPKNGSDLGHAVDVDAETPNVYPCRYLDDAREQENESMATFSVSLRRAERTRTERVELNRENCLRY